MRERERRRRFEELAEQYSSDLFRYAFWVCHDRVMAEELVQETFTRAWRSIDKLREEKAAKSWLFTILRREYARQFERIRPDFDDVDMGTIPAAQAEYDTSTEAFVLRRALEKLPEEYREPLVLQVIGGYSCEEIAEIMDSSAGAIMTRLFRARQKLREMLTGDADGDRSEVNE